MNTLPVQADWYTVTEVGITVIGDPTLEQIDQEIAMYNTLRELSTWALADLVKYAFEKYGRVETYDIVSSLSRYERTYLINIVSVSNKVDREDRLPLPMTFSHHQAVAPLAPTLQREWLGYATDKLLTRDELREDIQTYGIPPTGILPAPKQVVIEVKPTLEETVMYYIRAVKRDDATQSLYYLGQLEKHVEHLI